MENGVPKWLFALQQGNAAITLGYRQQSYALPGETPVTHSVRKDAHGASKLPPKAAVRRAKLGKRRQVATRYVVPQSSEVWSERAPV